MLEIEADALEANTIKNNHYVIEVVVFGKDMNVTCAFHFVEKQMNAKGKKSMKIPNR